ncbi:DUF1028 domain-containing protein [Nitrospirillum sp. BR 11164]|uniref:DUF1028 domain-containing protein n=1 Tax=Nitrospirillum sp. BR 11164 TaxID=3104324 RepID=UPI002AFFBBD3|nr:DUF1028 domain-containing protein [Nitrospirillum sp. BR 11164]MEA1651859.1 DUF1028 domain-containing protein [Nitrospirillum sp. BR 11164]
MPMRWWSAPLALAGLIATTAPAGATFSIIACDHGRCGVAVATNNLAVGASVDYAQAGVGAVVTQFETNPAMGPKGLSLMAAGHTPADALAILLREDGDFDGEGVEARQVALVDAQGRTAVFTGREAMASAYAGDRQGPGYAVQGNGLAGPAVLTAMEDAYKAARGGLEDRLLAALEAGQAAGGQSIGKLSAALVVRTSDGFPQDLDLRVDASAQPLPDLRALVERHHAWQAVIRADRAAGKGDKAAARAALAEAAQLAHGWDRVWRRAARVALMLGDTAAVRDYLARMVAANPVWGRQEAADPAYRDLASPADAASAPSPAK